MQSFCPYLLLAMCGEAVKQILVASRDIHDPTTDAGYTAADALPSALYRSDSCCGGEVQHEELEQLTQPSKATLARRCFGGSTSGTARRNNDARSILLAALRAALESLFGDH